MVKTPPAPATELSPDELDAQIRALVEQRAKLEAEALAPLRDEHRALVMRITERVKQYAGLNAAKFITMTPAELETFIIEHTYKQQLGQPAPSRRRMKVPPKYRNPKDSDMTWTGRGAQPIWVREYLAKGGRMETLLIDKTAKPAKVPAKKAAKKKR